MGVALGTHSMSPMHVECMQLHAVAFAAGSRLRIDERFSTTALVRIFDSQHVAKGVQQLHAAALAAGALPHLLRAHQRAPHLHA